MDASQSLTLSIRGNPRSPQETCDSPTTAVIRLISAYFGACHRHAYKGFEILRLKNGILALESNMSLLPSQIKPQLAVAHCLRKGKNEPQNLKFVVRLPHRNRNWPSTDRLPAHFGLAKAGTTRRPGIMPPNTAEGHSKESHSVSRIVGTARRHGLRPVCLRRTFPFCSRSSQLDSLVSSDLGEEGRAALPRAPLGVFETVGL